MKYPYVSVVISNHDGRRAAILDECIDSVVKLNYPNFEIIFVDNASDDDSVNFVKTKYGYDARLRIIENSINNYTKGLNLAINQASGKYVLFVSNDTIIDRGCLGELASAMEENLELALAAPKLLKYNNPSIIDCVGGTMDFFGNQVVTKQGMINDPAEKGVIECLGVGALYIARRAALLQVGLFDPEFNIGYDDVDLALRMRLKGYKVAVVLSSIAYHRRGITSTSPDLRVEVKRHFYKTRVATLIKNYEFINLIKVIPIVILIYLLTMLSDLLEKDALLAFVRIQALFWNLKRLRYILRQRAFVQNYLRQTTDESLKNLFAPNQLINVFTNYLKLYRH